MNQNDEKLRSSRRKFIASSAAALAVLPVLSRVASPALVQAQGATQPLDPTNSTAVALGYIHDASKVDVAKFPKRKGPEGEKQFCHNCMFYNQGGKKIEGQAGEWGVCTIFPMGLVNSQGWCNTWAPKPG